MRQPNISTELLQTFITVIEQGGFNRAALRLYKTQSTISQHIRKLESELGVSLFAVEGRRKLTPMGEQFFSYAKRWLALQEEAVFALAKMELQGEVRIGVSHSLSEGVLPELLARFARTYPQVNLLVETGGSADLIQGYAQGRLAA
jgi:DNA-binding transcriptional LysR family regulator